MPPSTPSWLHLSDDERIVWESRPHPITMGIRIPVALLLVLGGFGLAGWSATDGAGALTYIGVALALVGAVVAFVQYIFWRNTRYVITSAELYKKHGVVSRNVTQFRLDRVQNTTLEQDAIGRLLGYGDLTVYTAGSGDPELTFERTPRPERAGSALSDQLNEAVDGTRSRSP
ncbi:PH domain-containing protein [Natronococcus wangiae]|uniref:PH domain-containing protein n=1 Tax=Natronococcus wangiae TaxID=3068275 RepID=UPI00273E705C|nr:PH domain-containing protein [Natronococcus sp. AD5]